MVIRYCCRDYNSKNINFNDMIKISRLQPVVIIDVRSKQEYKEGHIEGAINIPLFNIKNDIKRYVIDKNQMIVVYCNAGIRSLKAQNILSIQGYKNVYNLEVH